jgi:hypothetical protein
MKTVLRWGAALLAGGCLWASYQFYYTDNLTSINPTNWSQNGSLSAGSNGATGNGSLVSTVAAPDGNDYDVRMTIHTANQGACSGSYSVYVRSTADTTTSYALTVNSAYNGTLQLVKKVPNSSTVLAGYPYYCADGMTMRLLVRGSALTTWFGPYTGGTYTDPSPIATGQPGVGISSSGAITGVELGPIDHVAPPPISQSAVSSSASPYSVDLWWPVGSDDPNGIGLAFYSVVRNNVWLGDSTVPNWMDETVTPGSNVTYTLYAYDQHGNYSTATNVSVTVPPTTQPDQRRVGVRPTGAYWGAAGEQIDLLSGNLNFSVPLIQAMGRGGWSVTFALSYNSQMWRQDSNAAVSPGVELLGADLGLGLGWKLQAGSIRPVWYNGSVHHFVYTDSSGAEYILDQNNNGVWTSLQGTYVAFDANANVLHFPDGSFWQMTVQSGAVEQDAGTLYPSVMEDTNGNFLS